MRHRLALLILVVGITFLPLSAQAQWQPNGVPICTAASGQFGPHIVSDGAGGAIVAWWDGRSGTFDYPIYVQRVNAAGVPQWVNNGVALSLTAGEDPAIVSDGAGGAIVAWAGARAQRVNASGVPQWTANGVALSPGAALSIVADMAGGAIVAWLKPRSGSWNVYAQHVNALGTPQWADTAVAICAVANQPFPYPAGIESDGAGGAIITWEDYRSVPSGAIYVQRVNAAGVPQWTPDGVALSTSGSRPAIASDGAGGAIVTWGGTSAQRVNASGVPQWTPNGVALSTAASSKVAVTIDSDRAGGGAIVSDGAGGAIVTWEDYRSGSDIYAQRVDAAGARQWADDGVAICAAAGVQYSPMISSDGAGGAVVTWEDGRGGSYLDIYSQRVNASGTPQWTSDGVAASTAAHDKFDPMIASDGAGGAIVTWEDGDIYAQHVTGPLNAVAIASFDASEADGVVTLRSAFRSDLGVESVNVYRAAATDDQMIVIERVGDVRGDGFEYVDRDVAPGQSYRYQIGVVDADGEFFSPVVTVSVDAITGALSQNQPNPFNPTTTIRFVLPVREQVTLAIYDTNGRLVRTLVNEVEGYGAHEVAWDGRDDDGVAMGSGVYFYRLHVGKHTESKKMVLLK